MDQDAFNLSVRKFLKTIGVNSQREIELAVQNALERGALCGEQPIIATATLEVLAVGLRIKFDGEIKLR